MITKQDFSTYMTSKYGEEDYSYLYKRLRSLLKVKDGAEILQLRKIVYYSQDERLQYRYRLAVEGMEFTPYQLDQYISTIEYALLHIDERS